MSDLIRATNLWGFDELVRQLGGDPLPLLERYHIPPEERRDDSSFLLYRNLTALFEDTVQTLNYPQLGLKLAEYQGMDILGPISVIARSAATVGDALDSIARYLHLHSPALGISNTLCEHQGLPCIRFQFTIDEDSSGGYRPQAYELSLSNSLQVMKLLCGDTFRLYSVHFMHARQAELDAYHDVFRCDAYFEQDWCGFYLPAPAFAMPLSSADHHTWELAERYLASQQAPNAITLSEDVSRLITTLLPTAQCTSAAIASHLSLHKRTLQRRLANEGVSYEQLLEEVRLKLLREYLMEPNLKLSQVAGLLGYSEQSAFNRACRQWLGTTPRAYRRQLLSQA